MVKKGVRRKPKGSKAKTITPGTKVDTTPTAEGNQQPLALISTGGSNENTTVTRNNDVTVDFAMEDQNETLKSAEKPPDHHDTPYKSALLSESKVLNPQTASTFLIHKAFTNDDLSINLSDDDTVSHENAKKSTTSFTNSIRMTMMYKLPSKKEGCSDEDAPKFAINKMNLMIKVLTNKLDCRVGPWTLNQAHSSVTDADLHKFLPDDVDLVESYVFGYNRFISPGKTGYVRLHIFFSDFTSLAEIQGVISQFKKPREQFLELSHSDAISPVIVGTLTGSVKAMSESPEFLKVMKTKFGLSVLGLWFSQPRTSRSGEFSTNKFTLHIEIERKDLPKRNEMEKYFNNSPASIDHNFFGTPLLLAKAYDYFADDDAKEQIDNHARKQTTLGSSLRSTVISGVQLCNWSNSTKSSTLHRDLMAIESIVEKRVVKGRKTATFKGRVFYAIIPDKKSWVFYFTKANIKEGRSIARGLPLFIRDHFKLDPAFFCTSEALTLALSGEWDYASRKFLSADEKLESDRLDLMEAEANAETEVFISKDQQIAMALQDEDISVETRLTKGDAAPPPARQLDDDLSEMTGSTRESKAKAYADKAVKEVAQQYSSTITNMQGDIGEKDEKIAQLELLLAQMKESPASDKAPDTEDDTSSPSKKRKSLDVSPSSDDLSL